MGSKDKPDGAFVAVPYEEFWCWIDRNDLASKTTLAAVTMLFNFLEGGDKTAPVLTTPTNRVTRQAQERASRRRKEQATWWP